MAISMVKMMVNVSSIVGAYFTVDYPIEGTAMALMMAPA